MVEYTNYQAGLNMLVQITNYCAPPQSQQEYVHEDIYM